MPLKICGVARSRAFRTLWMAKELGLDYDHVKIDFATGDTRTPEHLALNPNGHVPVIDDDGFILWESMAINLAILPEAERDAAAADGAEKQLAQPLQVLDGALARSANLLGTNFTVADLNVASILSWARPAQIDTRPFPKVAEWLKNCAERPAARAARQRE